MRIRIFALFLILAIATSGCASLKEKFIPKKKETTEEFRRYQVVRQYDVHPSMKLYTKRYIFWKNWQTELLKRFGNDPTTSSIEDNNRKKIVVAVEENISNLYDMKRMLVDEKGDQLQGLIDEMEEVEKDVKKGRISGAIEVRIRKKVESVGRAVKRDFSYTKVRGFIRDDFRTD
jgi:hypothetical protein